MPIDTTPVRTTWTAHGEPALVALEAALGRARSADPLAPVTVVTPSPSVAVTTRRAMARRLGGVVGVSFQSIGALAELIAAPRLAAEGLDIGVDRELLVAAVRVALRDQPGVLGSIAGHRSTWDAVAATIVELDGLDDGGRARVRATGVLPAEMARLHDLVTARIGTVGSAAVARLASAMVADGTTARREIGAVVVHLPERLSRTDMALLRALAGTGTVEVVLASAGRAESDADVARDLAPLGVRVPSGPELPPLASPTAVVSANDIDDEVRAAVRRLLALADAGTPLHRMALVHPAGAPYARVVSDVLTGTGMPHSGPTTRTLGHTAPGRVLLGLLSVLRSGFARQEVVDLWATGVIVDQHGDPLPFAAFDELSRRLGVVRGIDRWRRGLDGSDGRIRGRLADAGGADEGLAAWVDEQLADNRRLRSSLDLLEELGDAAPTTWTGVADWAGSALDRLCGPVTRRSWPDHELDADVAVRTALGRLVALDRVEPDPRRTTIFETIETVLEAPAPRSSRPGAGLLVTTLDRPPVTPLAAVAVVGLVEGQAPRVPADDVLLGDALRGELGLGGMDDRHRAQRRAFDAALASAAEHRIVTYARHDQRSGRTMVPSRWLVDAIEDHCGDRPEAEDLMAGRPTVGVELVDSYSAGLEAVAAGAVAPLHAAEWAFAQLVASPERDTHPAAADPTIAAASRLSRARQSESFTRFDGNLDGAGIDVTALGVLSPTSLETYAACPRRWFFSHALRLRATDRPEEIHRIQPRDKGSLVHAVLERFFDEAITAGTVPAPGNPWPDGARRRMTEIAEEACAELEERGLTGHPRWWEHDRAEIQTVLQEMLTADADIRERQGTMPVAVEFTFGREGAPPLEIDLGDGCVIKLSGQADRIDLGSGQLTVWDYKYGGVQAFGDLAKPEDDGGDPLARGQKLQLVAYAMAAAERHDVEGVAAAYWFLRPDALNQTIGYGVDPGLQERFRRVLGVLADGIDEGRFPARPGAFRWHRGGYDHCNWCDFDAICPQDRDEEWERVRLDPGLRRYGRLVEDGSRSVIEDEVAP